MRRWSVGPHRETIWELFLGVLGGGKEESEMDDERKSRVTQTCESSDGRRRKDILSRDEGTKQEKDSSSGRQEKLGVGVRRKLGNPEG